MASKLSILGFAGSLRQGSYNRAILRAAQEMVPSEANLEIFDLAGIPPFNQDLENRPAERVVEFKAAIRAADAPADRHPRIQLLDAGGFEERSGQRLPTLRRQRPGWKTGGNHGRFGGHARHREGPVPSAPELRLSEHAPSESSGGNGSLRAGEGR